MSLKIFTTPISEELARDIIKRHYMVYHNTDAFWGWKAEHNRGCIKELLIEELAKLSKTYNTSSVWCALYNYVYALFRFNRSAISPRLCVEQIQNAISPIGVIGIMLEDSHDTELLYVAKRIARLLAVAVYGNDNYKDGVKNWVLYHALIVDKIKSFEEDV